MASSATSIMQRAPEPYSALERSSSPQPAFPSGVDTVLSPATAYVATATTTDSTSPLPIGAVHALRSTSVPPIQNDSLSASTSSMALLPPTGSFPVTGNSSDDPEVDEAILQALRSPKERLFMLSLGEAMENLINERSAAKPHPRKTYQPSTTYHRLLIHRCSQYYKCTPEVDNATKSITVFAVVDSRIPPRRISELVPAETAAALPSFKIMRRNTPEQQRSKGRSPGAPSSSSSASASAPDTSPSIASGSQCSDVRSPSVDGAFGTEPTDNDEDSDAVLRSLGIQPKGRNGNNGGSNTPRKTIEEREAAYAEARNRIFMDFEEKEKAAARLRADREREREVTELHRELADSESHQVEGIPEILPNGLANGRLPYPRPATVGPIEQDGPLRVINGVDASSPGKVRERTAPIANNKPPVHGLGLNGNNIADPNLSANDSAASLVSYPTLYDPDSNQDQRPPNGHPPNPQHYPPAPPPTSFDPNAHPYVPPHGPHAGYNSNPYYFVPMGGMPPMNGVPPMAMGAYPPYAPVAPNQQHPGQMGHGMMGMVPYPYYPQMGPPPNWGENQVYPNGNPDGPSTENGYPMYGHPPNQPPHQPYWQPPHPQQQQPSHDMPPPPPPNNPYATNGPMNGANYPPHIPYYNPALQQQPYPQAQNQPYPPSAPQQYPPHHQYNPQPPQQPQQRGPPPPQPQRQLWTPGNNGNNEAKRGGHNRNSFSNNQQRSGAAVNRGGQPNGHAPTTTPPTSGNTRTGPAPRAPVSSPRDYGPGPASLIATPMSGSSSLSGGRSRNSSISSTSVAPLALRNNVWTYANPSNIPEGSIPMFGFGMRASGSAPAATMTSGGILRMGMGDRRRSGSISGSVSDRVSVAGDESGAMTPLDETASMASSSMSSTSSSRTFTSTSSKHPSLPPRPDWAVGLLPGAPGSSHSSARGKSTSSSNSSNPAHSRTHSFQSTGRPSPYSILQPTDFPPLPTPINLSPQRPVLNPSSKNTVWNGNPRTALQPAAASSNQGRFDEQDAKYTRPPSKGAAALFDHKQSGKGNVRATTPVGGQVATSSEEPLEQQMAQLTVADQAAA